jgi:hypothetical protein
MQQQSIQINPTAKILVQVVHGDLRVAGWDRNELMVKTSGSQLVIAPDPEPIKLSCDEDVILYLPHDVTLNVEKVDGDASLQALHGPVTLGPIAGDLTLKDLGPVTLATVAGDASFRNIGALNAESVSGDFAMRSGHGVCAIDHIGGDASIRDIDDMVAIENVGSDVYIRNVHAGVNISAGADVALYLEPLAGQTYDISSGDDLILRIPPDSNVKIHLTGGSPDSIHVDFPGIELPDDCSGCEVIIGTASDDMAEMVLTAGDDLLVTSRADSWESAADFGVGMRDGSDWAVPPFTLPDDFSERINQRVQAAMERAQSHIAAATRRAEANGHRASVKIEAAMRRAEAKARAAEVRARRGQANINIGRWNWDVTPHGPVQSEPPVSDEERLTILKMLQEKKITVEEAEKLLAALEGKPHS